MNILKIKPLAENRAGGLKQLAKDIEMSEANLHRCLNFNKISANDLEKIAKLLNVPVGYFFDEVDKTGNNLDEINELKQEVEQLKNKLANTQNNRANLFLSIPIDYDGEFLDLREIQDKVFKIQKM